MYTRLCLVLLVLTVVLPDGTISWGIRLPRIRIPNPICRVVCSTVCTPMTGVAQPLCHLSCPTICKKSITEVVRADEEYKVVPISRDFRHYDLNNDTFISAEEFAKVQKVPLDEVYKVFQYSDLNGDNKLDAEEFAAAPFMFEKEKRDKMGNVQEKTDRQSETEETVL